MSILKHSKQVFVVVLRCNGNKAHVYSRKIPAIDIVLARRVAVPPAAKPMISTLDTKAPKHRQ